MLKKVIVVLLVIFYFSGSKVYAITPPGVNPLPQIPFVMLDCENKDWGKIHPEWGPVGGWRNFGGPGCGGGMIPEDYIRHAKDIKVTLPDGRVISKPVGIGIKFNNNNVDAWKTRLNSPEFDNLAFLVAMSPNDPYGEVSSSEVGWAINIMGRLAAAFPTIPVFFQACSYSSDLCNRSVNLPEGKSISVKCNGWYPDLSTAMMSINGELAGGQLGFASVYHDRMLVGFEPKTGFGPEDAYWSITQALSHHPDFFDIAPTSLDSIAQFKTGWQFDLFSFLIANIGKTIDKADSVWTVLRQTQIVKTCCGTNADGSDLCGWPDCCYTSVSTGRVVCTGPQKGNFDYWLYQKDDIANGKTVSFISRQSNLMPDLAKSHPYGWYTTRRTDQATGNSYMYFDIDDSYVNPSPLWKITATFVNKGTDSLSLEYKNIQGILVKNKIIKGPGLGTVDNWVDYTWKIYDADFSNQLAGVDFRLNAENDGDEIIHRLIAKRVDQLELIIEDWNPSFSQTESPADVNQDGKIDEKDLTITLKNWHN